MYITFHGNTCIRIQEKTQARDITLIIDPYTNASTPVPGIGAGNIVCASRGENNLKTISGDPFLIASPGEYEIKEVMINGISHGETTIYRFDIDGVRFVHVGLMTGTLDNTLLEGLGAVDILFVPVGGENTLKPHQAVHLIQSIQPRIVIPIAYTIAGVDDEHGPLAPFLKELGQHDIQAIDKYKVAKKTLPTDDMEIIVLDVPTA